MPDWLISVLLGALVSGTLTIGVALIILGLRDLRR
jgi:hypothetical protein